MSPRSLLLAASAALGLAACDACEKKPAPTVDAASDAPPDAPDAPEAAAPVDAAAPTDAAAPEAAASRVDPPAELDGGSACKRTWGPAILPFHGPATLHADGTTLLVVSNDQGRARVHRFSTTEPAPKAPEGASAAMNWPPCEVAGAHAYCVGRGGAVTRAKLDGSDPAPVATAAPGTRASAAPLGAGHAVVAYLQRQKTSEGEMLQAFVTLDQGEAVRLSDDGAGATSVRLVPFDAEHVLAVYLDARTAMVPVHARTLTLEGGRLSLSRDVVVFVGGPPERGADFTVARAGARPVVLFPNAKDALAFGMAAVALPEPVKEDQPAVWSLYPNGLDPAPIAATTEPLDAAYVARVRPLTADPKAPRVLELGRVDRAAVFTSLGVVDTARSVRGVDVTVDKTGAVWLVYGDAETSWLERRACPR